MNPSIVPSQLASLWTPPDPTVMYIAPGDDSSQAGTGSPTDPFRVTPSVDFDDLLWAVGPETRRITLYPGTYLTRGVWAHEAFGFTSCPRPIELVGSGSSCTTIRLAEDAVKFAEGKARRDLEVMRLGKPWSNNGPSVVAGIMIDGNRAAHPEHAVVGGLTIWGNDCEVLDVRFRGLSSRLLDGLEAFGLSLRNWESGPHTGIDGASRIHRVYLEHDTAFGDTYVTAIYPGYVRSGRPVAPTVVSQCGAVAKGPGRGHAAFAFNAAVRIRDSWCHGFDYGLYNDTDQVLDVVVDGCSLDVDYAGLALTAANAEADKQEVTVTNTTFRYTADRDEAIGLVAVGEAAFHDILLENNRFITKAPFTLASVKAPRSRNIRFVKNILPDGGARLNLHGISPDPILTANLRSDGRSVALANLVRL